MNKLKLEPMRPQTARGYRYLAVPKELIENNSYSGLDYGAVILYSKMVERAGLSARNEDKFTDESGRLFIIYTVEQMEKDIQRSHPTVVKFTKQLADIGLIEKVRQGQGKPSKIYIMDFASAPHAEPENPTSKDIEPQEVNDFNFKKSSDFTSRSKDSELQEVKNFNAIELNNKDPENKELHPTNHPADLEEGWTEELDIEEVQAQVRRQVEYTVLCENYDEDMADEVVEIITEIRCRDSPEMQIGKAKYPMKLVQKRMESLTYEHVCYVLDNLGRAGPVRNPHGYLTALLFNAPSSCNTAVQAAFNANYGK